MDDARTPLTLQEMASILKRRTATHGGLAIEIDSSQRNPRAHLTSSSAQGRWVEIELDDEVFFLKVDGGFELVASELWAEEQAELIVDLADLAAAYLEGTYQREERQGIFGRRRTVLRFQVNGSDYLLRRRGGE